MVILGALLGTLAGIATGLIPGIHVNTVAALLLAASASCASLGIEYSALLAFTCSLAISHTFFDVLPGLFLGVPGDETFALLPGHRLVRKGEGQTTVQLSVAGSAIGLILGILILAALLALGNLLGSVERLMNPWIFLLLAGVSVILIATDRHKTWSLFTFLASGLLGIAVFGSPLIAGGTDSPVNALFPSLAGLFGVAGLLFAIATGAGSHLPTAATSPPEPHPMRLAWPGFRGGLAGLLVGLLPGLGAANAATLLLLLEQWRGRRASDDEQDRAYLVTTSSLNTSEALFAIAALYLIGRSRSGASIAVEQILGGVVSAVDLLLIAVCMTGAGAVAFAIMWGGGPRLASWFRRVDYAGLNWGVVGFLTALTFLLLGVGGLTILISATAVGLIPLLFGVRRAQLMGFFLVPTMLFYSGYEGRLVNWLSIGRRTAPLLPSITLLDILLGVAAAAGAAVVIYILTREASYLFRRYQARGSPVLLGGTLAAGLGAGAVLILAVLGRAYPPDPELSELSAVATSAAVAGRISRVIDGDTFEIASACRRFRVRLKGIDAPELGTTAGESARDWAEANLGGQTATWRPVGVDVYGRFLGDIHLEDGTFVNAELVRRGHAEADTRSPSRHVESFRGLERAARRAGRGLWGSGAPQAPPAAAPPAGAAAALARWDDNGNGRISCAEARRHGIAPVPRGHPAYRHMRDGDNDGVVCE